MKKFVLSALSLVLTAGLMLAASVVLVDFDGKELKVKDGDKESTYKVTDKTTFKAGDKDVPLNLATKVLSSDNAKGKLKIDIAVDGDKVTEVKMPERKKKTDK
jgi:hypothetical protein